MIYNIFKKSYLVDNTGNQHEEFLKFNPEEVIYLSSEELDYSLDDEKFLMGLCDKYVNTNFVNPSLIRFVCDHETFNEITKKYIRLLKLTPALLEPIEEWAHLIAMNIEHNPAINTKFDKSLHCEYDLLPFISKECIAILPAEFLVNVVNEYPMATEKFTRFMTCDFMQEMLETAIYLFNIKRIERRMMEGIHNIYLLQNGKRFEDIGAKFGPDLFRAVYKLLYEIYGVESKLYPFDLAKYVQNLSSFSRGYSREAIIKFNVLLAKKLLDTPSYKIIEKESKEDGQV